MGKMPASKVEFEDSGGYFHALPSRGPSAQSVDPIRPPVSPRVL
jgi:hypothetical protein